MTGEVERVVLRVLSMCRFAFESAGEFAGGSGEVSIQCHRLVILFETIFLFMSELYILVKPCILLIFAL
jgi:hypothetical protein